MQKKGKSEGNIEGLLKLRDAALQLGISFPTIKQWIYKKKIRSNRTAGGHHRIPQSEVDKDCFSEPVARPSNNAKKKSGA
jgi:excisionase family DNA binding protein